MKNNCHVKQSICNLNYWPEDYNASTSPNSFPHIFKFIHILNSDLLLHFIYLKEQKKIHLCSVTHRMYGILNRILFWNILTKAAPCALGNTICHWTCCFHNSTPEQTGKNMFQKTGEICLTLETSDLELSTGFLNGTWQKKKKKKWGEGCKKSWKQWNTVKAKRCQQKSKWFITWSNSTSG